MQANHPQEFRAFCSPELWAVTEWNNWTGESFLCLLLMLVKNKNGKRQNDYCHVTGELCHCVGLKWTFPSLSKGTSAVNLPIQPTSWAEAGMDKSWGSRCPRARNWSFWPASLSCSLSLGCCSRKPLATPSPVPFTQGVKKRLQSLPLPVTHGEKA